MTKVRAAARSKALRSSDVVTQPLHDTIQAIATENPASAAGFADDWIYLALCERDPAAVERALAAIPAQGLSSEGYSIPRSYYQGLAARAGGDSETARDFFQVARVEVEKSLQAQPDYGESLTVLGMIDAALGRKDDAIREGRRAVELVPLSKDSINGAYAISHLAVIYSWTEEKDAALEELAIAAKIPGGPSYGELRLYPHWDALRGDPRFEQIVASLAPADDVSTHGP